MMSLVIACLLLLLHAGKKIFVTILWVNVGHHTLYFLLYNFVISASIVQNVYSFRLPRRRIQRGAAHS